MKYLVMETHQAYAVVLDEGGRMLKTANMGYCVGDRVTDVTPMKMPKKYAVPWKKLAALAAACACLCLIYFGAVGPNFVSYGTVRITINPDVLISVSRTGRVVGLKGLNQDGRTLIEAYSYSGKQDVTAASELVELASKENYLKNDGRVTLTVSSASAKWNEALENRISQRMDDGVAGKTVTFFIARQGEKTPDLVVTTGGESSGTFTYDQWRQLHDKALPASPGQSSGQSAQQWGQSTGDAFEKWGEETGDSYEKWGESVGKIFDDGYDGKNDLNALFDKIKELLN